VDVKQRGSFDFHGVRAHAGVMPPIESFLSPLKTLHERIRDAVVAACEKAALEDLSSVAKEEEGDTIYAVDKISEDLLVEFIEREIATRTPVVLIAEGLDGGKIVLPHGTAEADAQFRIIVDPIDGTRGIMYQKRSAWILTGVAPNKGPQTALQDIELAIQTEIPLVKQHLSDSLWATKGKGAKAERYNRISGERKPLHLKPSGSRSIAHGFSTIARFFPGAREELAAIDDTIVREALGPVQPGKAQCFEDQYISSGGQFYELMAGHDRFIADLRPLVEPAVNRKGFKLGICCHPYDVCTELIARELGVIITDGKGGVLRAPLAVEPDVAWAGYANEHIRAQIEPALLRTLKERRLSQP
jgi:fructose-1,6-bisphosphatase/inositol monophosphatase family enzyme